MRIFRSCHLDAGAVDLMVAPNSSGSRSQMPSREDHDRQSRWGRATTRGRRAAGAGLVLPMPGRITAIAAAIVATVLIVLGLTGYVEKWLWMSQLDYVGIFWKVLSVQCVMGVAGLHRRIRVPLAESPSGREGGADRSRRFSLGGVRNTGPTATPTRPPSSSLSPSF